VISGSANPDAMTCAAPKRDAPAALQLPANFAQASQKTLVRMAIFHGSGVNSRSCPFQQSQKKNKGTVFEEETVVFSGQAPAFTTQLVAG